MSFTFEIQASAIFTTTAPTFDVLIDDEVVSSGTISTGFGQLSTFSFDYSYDGAPTSLSFSFPSAGGGTNRVIVIERVLVNGQELQPHQYDLLDGATTNAEGKAILREGDTFGVDVAQSGYIFGSADPTLEDLGFFDSQNQNDPVLNVSNSADNFLLGDNGVNDTIFGLYGDDKIAGQSGNDILYGNDGNDTIVGGEGDDVLGGHQGDDILYGGTGNDVLRGGDGNDILNAGDGDDFLSGDGGNDTLAGGLGADRIYGGDGNDEIRGDGGDDRIYGGAGIDTILGGAGNDLIGGDDGNDLIEGESGDDAIYGGAGVDTINGGDIDRRKWRRPYLWWNR
jgi:Ca2+-binding RTX toxin-like protein